MVGDEGRHAPKSSHYGLNAKDNMGRVGQDDRRRLYDGRRTSAAEALRELCANVGFEETVNTAVQRLRNRAKASPALLLDAMGQQTPWDAARCAELVALGLGLGPCAPV